MDRGSTLPSSATKFPLPQVRETTEGPSSWLFQKHAHSVRGWQFRFSLFYRSEFVLLAVLSLTFDGLGTNAVHTRARLSLASRDQQHISIRTTEPADTLSVYGVPRFKFLTTCFYPNTCISLFCRAWCSQFFRPHTSRSETGGSRFRFLVSSIKLEDLH